MKRILVGLDGSPHERVVLAAAVSLAQKLGGRLILFRAVTLPIGLPPTALSVPPDDLAAVLIDGAEQHLATLARGLPDGVDAQVSVGVGTPWRAVCEGARDADCDLIVIGSHGFSGLDRLVGTTAAKIVNHANCSVLVTRASAA